MKAQIDLCRSSETALDRGPMLGRKSLLALAGAAVVLLGCQQHEERMHSGTTTQPSMQRDDTSPAGGPSGLSSEGDADAGGAGEVGEGTDEDTGGAN